VSVGVAADKHQELLIQKQPLFPQVALGATWRDGLGTCVPAYSDPRNVRAGRKATWGRRKKKELPTNADRDGDVE
jgi:hypothetical protein